MTVATRQPARGIYLLAIVAGALAARAGDSVTFGLQQTSQLQARTGALLGS